MNERFSTSPKNEGATREAEWENEQLKLLLIPTKTAALSFLEEHGAPSWLRESITHAQYLDEVVSGMRHLEGGQSFILEKLALLQPDLSWNRGGNLLQWKETVGAQNMALYSHEELDTYIVDGGGNGVLGKPGLALSYTKVRDHQNPAFYTLSIQDLAKGVAQQAISLATEHNYDLCVSRPLDTDWRVYLQFCREHLQIEPLKTTP